MNKGQISVGETHREFRNIQLRLCLVVLNDQLSHMFRRMQSQRLARLRLLQEGYSERSKCQGRRQVVTDMLLRHQNT